MARLHAPHLTPRRHRMPHLDALIVTATAIADRAVLSDIRSEGVPVGEGHARCYDVRPMLDQRERGPESVDMASEAIAYAISRGLVEATEGTPWLVRIVRKQEH